MASCLRCPLQDVWDLCWASDNPDLLAVMEKGKLVVLRGTDADDPVASSAWLAGFSDLQVRVRHGCWSSSGWKGNASDGLCPPAQNHAVTASGPMLGGALLPCKTQVSSQAGVHGCAAQVHAVLLDDIMQQPQTPELAMVTDYETRSLR